MGWVRPKVRLGACIALFALAVQFALSFAHVHLPGRAAKAPGAELIALLALPFAPDVAPMPVPPAKPHPKGLAGDVCAVCALIQMAGLSLPGVPPQLTLLDVVRDHAGDLGASFTLARAAHVFAQPRAPPIP